MGPEGTGIDSSGPCPVVAVGLSVAKTVGDAIKLGDALQADQPLLHVAAGAQGAAVPVGHLAETQTAEALAAVLHQQMEVTHHEGQAFSIGSEAAGMARPFPALQLT